MEFARTRGSLLRLLILFLTAMDQTVLSAAAHHHGGYHPRIPRRIHLPHAVGVTRKFICREPQTRAYNLKDLLQNLHPSESANQPVYIVVKRCDSHSGCCVSPDLSCTPVQSSIYHEEMEIEIWSVVTNSTRRQWIRVEQHGSCSCEISNASERLRRDRRPPGVSIL